MGREEFCVGPTTMGITDKRGGSAAVSLSEWSEDRGRWKAEEDEASSSDPGMGEEVGERQ